MPVSKTDLDQVVGLISVKQKIYIHKFISHNDPKISKYLRDIFESLYITWL